MSDEPGRLTAENIVIENGLHEAHQMNDPAQARANLAWFAKIHAVYRDGDINVNRLRGLPEHADRLAADDGRPFSRELQGHAPRQHFVC